MVHDGSRWITIDGKDFSFSSGEFIAIPHTLLKISLAVALAAIWHVIDDSETAVLRSLGLEASSD